MSKLDFSYGNESHIGLNPNRSENQDFFGYFKTAIGDMFIVCDGMGGAQGGGIASQLAVNALGEFSSRSRIQEPEIFLEKALSYANKVIATKASSTPELSGMGTTCVVVLLQLEEKAQAGAWIANVGDSRIYREREKKLVQLTRDHSRVQQLVDGGIITEEEALEHSARHIITRALGIAETVEVDVNPVDIELGDRFILASDGVHGMVPNDEFEIIADTTDPQKCAATLIIAANNHGGLDNSTAMVVDIVRRKNTSSDLIRKFKIPGIVLAVILVILLAIQFIPGLTGGEVQETDGVAEADSLLPDTSEVIVIPLDTLQIEFNESDRFVNTVVIQTHKAALAFNLLADTTSMYTMRVDDSTSPVDIQITGVDVELDTLVEGGFLQEWKAPVEGVYLVTFENMSSSAGEFSFECSRDDLPVQATSNTSDESDYSPGITPPDSGLEVDTDSLRRGPSEDERVNPNLLDGMR